MRTTFAIRLHALLDVVVSLHAALAQPKSFPATRKFPVAVYRPFPSNSIWCVDSAARDDSNDGTRVFPWKIFALAVAMLISCFLVRCARGGDSADDSAEPLSPAKAAAGMIVPKGFNVTLFAGEPDVKQPIGFCIDDRGRLWVAEAYSYPNHQLTGRDRIVIFEDADGDGKFDTKKVFYDQLNYVTGIEVGFGGAWVMSPPFFYFIPDKDGDDRPDGEPQLLLDGFGNHGNAHNIANGFSWGPDGWLYGTHGRTNWSLIGRPGTPEEERIRFDGGVYRYHPLRHEWESYADGTTNPWGSDFDDYG